MLVRKLLGKSERSRKKSGKARHWTCLRSMHYTTAHRNTHTRTRTHNVLSVWRTAYHTIYTNSWRLLSRAMSPMVQSAQKKHNVLQRAHVQLDLSNSHERTRIQITTQASICKHDIAMEIHCKTINMHRCSVSVSFWIVFYVFVVGLCTIFLMFRFNSAVSLVCAFRSWSLI